MNDAPFQFRSDESVDQAVRRIMQEQLAAALGLLAPQSGRALDERIHGARKACKRLRATLRLVRPAIGGCQYRRQDRELRDAARPLAPLRDANVLFDAVERLRESFFEEACEQEWLAVRDALASDHRRLVNDSMHVEALLENCQEAFLAVRASLETWPPIRDRWAEPGKGLRRTYGRARRAFRRAGDRPRSRRLHVWRKHTKYLGYQLELFADAGSKVSKRAKRADAIASLLGDDHDLVLLEQRLRSFADKRMVFEDFDAFSAIIRRRRTELQRDAFSQAKSLFRHGPKRFTRRVKQIG